MNNPSGYKTLSEANYLFQLCFMFQPLTLLFLTRDNTTSCCSLHHEMVFQFGNHAIWPIHQDQVPYHCVITNFKVSSYDLTFYVTAAICSQYCTNNKHCVNQGIAISVTIVHQCMKRKESVNKSCGKDEFMSYYKFQQFEMCMPFNLMYLTSMAACNNLIKLFNKNFYADITFLCVLLLLYQHDIYLSIVTAGSN